MPVKQKKFNWRIFLRTRRYILIALSFGFVAVLLLLLGIIPQSKQILSLRSELDKEKPRYAALQDKLKQLEAVEITAEFQQRDLIENTLPSKKPLLELLEGLNTAALASGIVVEEFNLTPGVIATTSATPPPTSNRTGRSPKAVKPVQGLDVNFTIAGSFAQIQRFAEVVEQIAPFTTITSLELSNPKQQPSSDGGVLFTAEIVTETSYFVGTIASTADTPLPVLTPTDKLTLNKIEPFVASNLPEQNSIQQGGAQDLFKIDGLNF